MTPEYNLLAHNILFLSGGILNILLIFVVLLIRRKKIDNLVVTFALMTASVAIFQISHVLGANTPSGEISRQIFMWNLCVIPIQIFMTHWFFALMGKIKENRLSLGIVYITGALLLIIHMIFPESYLLKSVPKLYLPYYYEPGYLQWLTRTWFHLVGAFYFWKLLKEYRHELDPIRKNRYLFTLLAVLYGFIVGETAVLLVYDIPFDPIWSSFFSLYTFLLAYAVIRYQLLDIHFIVQRTVIYALVVSSVVGFIIIANSSDYLVQDYIPNLPIWIVPFLSGVLAVLIGFIFWHKLRENDVLKYEFITVITHKFRTPLTQSKWAVEELISNEHNSEKLKNLNYIKQSNEKLINLTGTMFEIIDSDQISEATLNFKQLGLCSVVDDASDAVKETFYHKEITLIKQYSPKEIITSIDRDKILFVVQTLLENACSYTEKGGRVILSVVKSGSKAIVSVADNGIGINRSDMRRIFSKFYRSHRARSIDTEGFGIGLFIARSIIKRHAGEIKAYSDGEGKGSTFSIILPIV